MGLPDTQYVLGQCGGNQAGERRGAQGERLDGNGNGEGAVAGASGGVADAVNVA